MNLSFRAQRGILGVPGERSAITPFSVVAIQSVSNCFTTSVVQYALQAGPSAGTPRIPRCARNDSQRQTGLLQLDRERPRPLATEDRRVREVRTRRVLPRQTLRRRAAEKARDPRRAA